MHNKNEGKNVEALKLYDDNMTFSKEGLRSGWTFYAHEVLKGEGRHLIKEKCCE